MPLQTALLQQSFNIVAANGEAFAAAFYKRLFTVCPEMRSMFKNLSLEGQAHKFLMTLILIIEQLDAPTYLKEILHRLGALHHEYNVEAHQYPLVGEVLLDTLAAQLGTAWTPELAQAWADAYAVVAGLMLDGVETSLEVGR